MPLVVLTGASGSGKTTIARAIEKRCGDTVQVFYFDQIGVPSVARMIAEHGSQEAWQRAKTFEWMAKLGLLCEAGHDLLFEGQTRLSFLAEAAEAVGINTYLPVLVDCDDATRARRLCLERRQLADEGMMTGADYLRRDARRRGCAILDTSGLALELCIACILAKLCHTGPR
jgi:hypothetical protein